MKKSRHSIVLVLFFVIILTNSSCFNHIRRIKDMRVKDVFVVYDTSTLRIPGNKFAIGIGILAKLNDSIKHPNDTILYTKGWMNGTLNWSNFNIKTFGCNYTNGKIELASKAWPEKGNIAVDVEVKTQNNKRFYLSIPKNYLIKTKLFAQNSFQKAPGNNIKLGLLKTYDNGYIETIKKKKDVTNFLSLCRIMVTGGEYNNGTFSITDDFTKIEYNEAGIIATPMFDRLLTDTFSIQLDYIDSYSATYSASSRFSAPSGQDGRNGNDAHCYGCMGEDGYNGYHGYDGLEGEHGSDIAVNIDAEYDSLLHTDLCLISVENLSNGQRKFFKINPKGGNLKVTSYGGNGGNGGDGGDGGNGGNGGAGETYTVDIKKHKSYSDSTGTHTIEVIEQETITKPGGHGGRGGYGGDGGYGGPGGIGGDIYIYYTEASYPYLHCIIPNSVGGNGGMSGNGGSAGRGGNGGNGNPNGSNGSSGRSGSSGMAGPWGPNGRVIYEKRNQ